MKSFQIPVRIGSNIKYLTFNSAYIRPQELVDKTLTKLKLQSTINYALFERSLGIDRLILDNENIYTLWMKWSQTSTSSTESLNSKFEFVIKKFQRSTKITNIAKKASLKSHKLYELGRRLVNNDQLKVFDASEESDSDHYENMLMDSQQEHSIYKYNCKINSELAEAKAIMMKLSNDRTLAAKLLKTTDSIDLEYLFGHYIGLDSSLL